MKDCLSERGRASPLLRLEPGYPIRFQPGHTRPVSPRDVLATRTSTDVRHTKCSLICTLFAEPKQRQKRARRRFG